MDKKPFSYQRLIRLAPALGDWTTLTINDYKLDEVRVSSVKNVNFDSLPRELMKTVHTLHYRMAERMVRKLSKDMQIKIDLHSIQAMQMSYEDFLTTQDEKVVQTDFVVSDLGCVNVIFDWNLADAIVNRLVGGKGEGVQKRKFTVIEGAGLQTQMEELVPSFSEEWRGAVSPDDVKFRFSFGPYVQDKTIALREAYVLFSFNMYFGKEQLKKMVIAYPNHLLKTFIARYDNFAPPPSKNIYLNKNVLSRLKVPVTVALGDAQLSMCDVKRLQYGDVVRLDRRLDEPIPIRLGDEVMLKGQMGQTGTQLYSLQVIVMDDDQVPMPVHRVVLPDPEPEPEPEPELEPLQEETFGSEPETQFEYEQETDLYSELEPIQNVPPVREPQEVPYAEQYKPVDYGDDSVSDQLTGLPDLDNENLFSPSGEDNDFPDLDDDGYDDEDDDELEPLEPIQEVASDDSVELPPLETEDYSKGFDDSNFDDKLMGLGNQEGLSNEGGLEGTEGEVMSKLETGDDDQDDYFSWEGLDG